MNIGVFCILIVVIEISGQIIYYLRHGKFIYQTSIYDNDNISYYAHIFERHPNLGVRLKKNIRVEHAMGEHAKDYKTITTTNRYTRWTGSTENDNKKIRVAVLGGSTTFGTEVTDSDTWPALLQAKLGDQFSVTNYGVPSFTSAEAMIQMVLLVPEIKPDFIVFYEGWNDLHRYHEDESPDYYKHGMELPDILQVPNYKEKSLLEKLNELSSIVRVATKIKQKLSRPSNTESCTTYDTPDPAVDRIYVRNLNTLKLLSEQIASSYTLFIPQVLNYHKFMTSKDNEACDWDAGGHVKNRAVPRLMDRLNSFMQLVCPNDDSKCLVVDSVSKASWEPDDFADWGHFSRKGGEKFIEIISQVILSKVKEGKFNNRIKNDSGKFHYQAQ